MGRKDHSNKYKLEMLGWVKHRRIEGLATSYGGLMELLGFWQKKNKKHFSSLTASVKMAHSWKFLNQLNEMHPGMPFQQNN